MLTYGLLIPLSATSLQALAIQLADNNLQGMELLAEQVGRLAGMCSLWGLLCHAVPACLPACLPHWAVLLAHALCLRSKKLCPSVSSQLVLFPCCPLLLTRADGDPAAAHAARVWALLDRAGLV